MLGFKLPITLVVLLVLFGWLAFLTSVPWSKLLGGQVLIYLGLSVMLVLVNSTCSAIDFGA